MNKNTEAHESDLNVFPMKAYKNLSFLKSTNARIIRILCELMEPKDRFKEEGVEHTIVLFGFARTLPPNKAKEKLKYIKDKIGTNLNASVSLIEEKEQAESVLEASKYYQAAYDLSKKLTEWSMSRKPKSRLHICSGGGPGIMEAANKGAFEANGKSIGLGISLPFEQRLNSFISKELAFEFKYFFIRKYWFVLLAKALVAFPGGFGTLDELFETLTLMQTGKIRGKTPIILFGSKFWKSLINWDSLVNWGMISKEDLDLIYITDSVEDAFNFLVTSIEKLDQEKLV